MPPIPENPKLAIQRVTIPYRGNKTKSKIKLTKKKSAPERIDGSKDKETLIDKLQIPLKREKSLDKINNVKLISKVELEEIFAKFKVQAFESQRIPPNTPDKLSAIEEKGYELDDTVSEKNSREEDEDTRVILDEVRRKLEFHLEIKKKVDIEEKNDNNAREMEGDKNPQQELEKNHSENDYECEVFETLEIHEENSIEASLDPSEKK